MKNPRHIYTAEGDLRIKCCNCRGAIRDGQEYVVEMYPHGSRIDYYHFECPQREALDPTRPIIVQGHDRKRSR